jgi:DNA primase catalytic core
MPSQNNRDKIDEIKSRLNIVDVIGRDIDLHKGSDGVYTGATSPTSKSGASLKVDEKLQVYKNFATSDGGDVFNWIAYSRGLDINRDFPEVLRIAAELAGVELAEMPEEERNTAKEKADIQTLLTDAAEIYYNNLKNRPELYEHIFKQWRITQETVDRFKIGYAPPCRNLKGLDKIILKKSGLVYVNNEMIGGEVFQGRLTFPYWKNGKVVYLIGRETEETPEAERERGMKYKKLLVHKEGREYVSPSVQNSFFYGEDSLRGSDYCIITEGVTDCIVMLQAGFPCISPVTVQFREKDHPKLISITKRLKRVYICNDNETNQAGLKGALNTAEALEREGIEARLIKLPKPDDLDKIDIAEYMKTATPEDFKKLMDSSLAFCDYLLKQQVIQKGSTSRDRLRAYTAFISTLGFMPDDEWKVFVTKEVRKKFVLGIGDIKNAVAEAEAERGRQKQNTTGADEQKPRGDGDEGEVESTRHKLLPLEDRLKEYPEEVVRKANEILDNGDPFLYICDTFNELHVGDRNLGETLACSIACTQILNAGIGIHAKPSGDA